MKNLKKKYSPADYDSKALNKGRIEFLHGNIPRTRGVDIPVQDRFKSHPVALDEICGGAKMGQDMFTNYPGPPNTVRKHFVPLNFSLQELISD
jgi:hypothetical protein